MEMASEMEEIVRDLEELLDRKVLEVLLAVLVLLVQEGLWELKEKEVLQELLDRKDHKEREAKEVLLVPQVQQVCKGKGV